MRCPHRARRAGYPVVRALAPSSAVGVVTASGAGAPSQHGVIQRQRSHCEWDVTQTWGPPQRGHGSSPAPGIAQASVTCPG